ncbi:MAG: acetate/propionate family kinase [Vulcanimicrobiaceae bacterium]
MADAIVALNSGSTSLKFAAYSYDGESALRLLCRGLVDDIEENPRFAVEDAARSTLAEHAWGAGHAIDQATALHFALSWIEEHLTATVRGAGHRIVIGGTRFTDPTVIDDEVLTYLDSLVLVDASHLPYNIAGVRALAQAFPKLPQVACFDTSFHRTMPQVAQIYALPAKARDAGVHHWGFHGISYDYISRQLPRFAPQARRVVAAHLGGGASVCAMLDGKSVETSMGFGAISGLPMSTRCGDVPADALLYLLRSHVYDDASLEKALYAESGLLGLSGLSEDMQVLESSDDPRAQAAVAYFVYSVTKYVGAYASVLGGLDAIVFTAGIGEHSIPVRAAICAKLEWLGLRLDEARNARHGPRISSDDSSISAWVIPTDEELMIAQHTRALLPAPKS